MMSKKKVKPVASLPNDLCHSTAVSAGFALLNPVASPADALAFPTDPPAEPKTLAADAISHLVEGWRYLSAATTALISNSHNQVVHLAYYAELRAAFALLACSGVRICYPNHGYLNAAGAATSPTWANRPTHKAVWELWTDWAKSGFADQLFADKLRIGPSTTLRSLATIVNSLSPSGSLAAWGVDFVDLSLDHDARNIASYETVITRTAQAQMQTGDLDFLRGMWQLLQPTSSGLQFEVSLVHYLIDLQLDELRKTPDFDEGAWYINVASQLAGATGEDETALLQTLKDRNTSTNLFSLAADTSTEWQNVTARALFLLRLASRAIEDTFSIHTGSSGKDWCRLWLQHSGLHDPVSCALTDVWIDYSELPTFQQPSGSLPISFRNDPHAAVAMRITRPDASLAWSLGL